MKYSSQNQPQDRVGGRLVKDPLFDLVQGRLVDGCHGYSSKGSEPTAAVHPDRGDAWLQLERSVTEIKE